MTDARTRLESTTFTPFSRLALAHAITVCGDVFVTVSLADSIFFSATTSGARGKVVLYLMLTMAPFAIVAPVIGPMLDRTRGGRRLSIAAFSGGRAILCVLMAGAIDNVLLYPLAFGMLVLSRGASVAKSALVPGVVDRQDELVLANSRLALVSVLGGALAAPFAAARAAGQQRSLGAAVRRRDFLRGDRRRARRSPVRRSSRRPRPPAIAKPSTSRASWSQARRWG